MSSLLKIDHGVSLVNEGLKVVNGALNREYLDPDIIESDSIEGEDDTLLNNSQKKFFADVSSLCSETTACVSIIREGVQRDAPAKLVKFGDSLTTISKNLKSLVQLSDDKIMKEASSSAFIGMNTIADGVDEICSGVENMPISNESRSKLVNVRVFALSVKTFITGLQNFDVRNFLDGILSFAAACECLGLHLKKIAEYLKPLYPLFYALAMIWQMVPKNEKEFSFAVHDFQNDVEKSLTECQNLMKCISQLLCDKLSKVKEVTSDFANIVWSTVKGCYSIMVNWFWGTSSKPELEWRQQESENDAEIDGSGMKHCTCCRYNESKSKTE